MLWKPVCCCLQQNIKYVFKELPNFHPVYRPLKAFFTDTYIQKHPEDQQRIGALKHLIALQVSLPTIIVIDTDLKAENVF